MPDDDWALGQNEIDVRNEARREYHRPVYLEVEPADEQASFCTGDTHCQAAADEHDLDCPVEQQLHDEIGF